VFGAVYFHEQSVEKRRAEAALLTYRDHLQDLVEARTAELKRANEQLERAAILEERQRIAAEMHDGLAQTLSTMGLKTSQATSLLEAGEVDRAFREVDELQEILGLAANDVRRAIASLQQSPEPRVALQDALRQLAAENSQSGEGTTCKFWGISEPVVLDNSDQEQVLRVVQEALLNARRHAASQEITVRLRRLQSEYHVLVEDNGIGFDPAEVARNRDHHFGLSIMRARASRIKGRLSVTSSPGNGTAVCLAWPAGATQVKGNGHEAFAEKPV
jgi:two-component system nitrate/nitrite sensor histidine kinase NarX